MKLLDTIYNRLAFAFHKVQCAEFPTIFGRILVAKFAKGGTIRMGKGVVINSSLRANPVGGTRTVFLIKGPQAVIELGDRVGMSNVTIGAYNRVTIGDDVWIGAGCKIFDNDFHSLVFEERIADVNIGNRPVEIKARAFIGADSMILKGVTIGEEAVVGAKALITKSVPAGEIWAGNPAKKVGEVRKAGQ